MKIFKSVILVAVIITAFLSCQKELSFDNGGISAGTLKKGTGGDCLPVVVTGVFKKDSVLTNANYIDVQINVSTPGTFDIRTDTVNGYAFSKAGSVVLGINTVRLYASGKPVTAGTNTFAVKYGTSTCTFDITVVGTIVQSAFTLGSTLGICTGATVGGTYTVGSPLTPFNTLTVQVNVTTIGAYVLVAPSTGGFVFTGTGIFNTTGLQNVTLTGNGTPLTAGTAIVTVSNIASTCTFSIPVLPAAGGSTAVFTLDGAPNTCTSYTIGGTYTAGSATSVSNTVKLNVTVQTAGTYTITTNTVNGIIFSSTGTLATGPQQIILTATGTPVLAGTFNTFKPNITSTCDFSVTFVAAPILNNDDYIPQTAFTNYSDKLVGGTAADTSYTQVSPNTIVKNGTTYKIFEIKNSGVPVDSILQRKNGGLYYQLFNGTYGFDTPFNTDGLLLDSSLAVSSTWTINLGANTASGLAATGKIKATIIEKGASATIAGNSYTSIIKVKYFFYYNILATGDVEYAQLEVWYAKGKGVVKQIINDVPATFTDVYETTRIQVY